MEQAKYKAVMDRLDAFSHEVGIECRRETLENGVELISFLTAAYEDGSGLVYVQLALLRELNEVDMAQIFTTVLPRIGEARSRMERAILYWNRTSILGSYGIYDEEDQLYHRYRLPLEEEEAAETTAARIISAVTLVWEEVARRYPAASAILNQGLTWEEARDQGLC